MTIRMPQVGVAGRLEVGQHKARPSRGRGLIDFFVPFFVGPELMLGFREKEEDGNPADAATVADDLTSALAPQDARGPTEEGYIGTEFRPGEPPFHFLFSGLGDNSDICLLWQLKPGFLLEVLHFLPTEQEVFQRSNALYFYEGVKGG